MAKEVFNAMWEAQVKLEAVPFVQHDWPNLL